MINGGIRFGVVERAQPFVCRNKKDENQSGGAEEGGKGGWKVDRGSERAVDREREREGRLRRRRPQRQRERKVNGEFNLVWQPPFPLGRKKKRSERARERGSFEI